jgi:hypothetical protein
MKNTLLTLALFCAVYVLQAQIQLQPAQYQKTNYFSENAKQEQQASTQRTAPNVGAPVYATNSVNSTFIAQYIPYGASNQQQLSTFAGVGTNGGSVGFMFKQPFTCSGVGPQALAYNLSTDGGLTWLPPQGNCMGNAPLTTSTTYVNSNYHPTPILHINDGGTTPNDLNLVYAGKAIDNATGNVAFLTGAANNLVAGTAPTIHQEDYAQVNYKSFAFTQRINGEFWAAGITPANVLEIQKGIWNNTTNNVAWNLVQSMNIDNSLAINSNGLKYLFEVRIAFSPNGNQGYIVMNGDLLGGWDNCSNAIICEYNSSNSTFDVPYEISFNDFPAAVSNVTQYVDASGNPISDRASMYNHQITVDYRGALHLHALSVPSGGNANVFYSGFASHLYDLSKDPLNVWGLIDVAAISKTKAIIGSGANEMQYYTTANISRSSDGHYIFFEWADTDTLGVGNAMTLDAPNLKGKIYDVSNNLISSEIDFTSSDLTWANIARTPKVSEVALEPTTGTFIVPTFVARFFGTPTITDPDAAIKEAEFHYFSNIEYTASQANIPVVWKNNTLEVKAETSLLAFSLSPNPATSAANLKLSFSKKEDVTLTLLNTYGQVVWEKKMPSVLSVKEDIWVKDWAKGVYYLRISSKTEVTTQKLVIE